MGYKINYEQARTCPNCGEHGLEDKEVSYDGDDVLIGYECLHCGCTFEARYRFDMIELSNEL